MLLDIAFPALGSHQRGTFIKLALRRAQAISVVNAAVIVTFDGEALQSAAITLGSVAPTIIHARTAEAFLAGKPLDEGTVLQAAELAAADSRPIDDLRGSAAYRHEMVRVAVMRGLRSLRDGRYEVGMPDDPVTLWGHKQGGEVAVPRLYAGGGEKPVREIRTKINGLERSFTGGGHKTLLRFLREDAGLTGTKEGCAEGECGACTVFLDGQAVMACMVPAPRADGAEIVTVEGLALGGVLHPIQQAFIESGAVQCGYCTPGFLMSGAKLLEERPHPTRNEIEQALTGNLCRCTSYYKIVQAIQQAAQTSEVIHG
jgi:carbon-monoxide dehydrogenase medium subunit